MIPIRSRLARSLSFQLVVDRDNVAAETDKAALTSARIRLAE